MIDAVFHWSGGKDSSLCLHKVLTSGQYNIKTLLTTVSDYDRISMHGVRVDLLEQQADAIGLPLDILKLPEMPDMEVYNQKLNEKLNYWKNQGVNTHIYGDIFLDDLKKYREEQLAAVGCNAVFPLWKQDTKDLVNEFVKQGFKATVVCCNARLMDENWVGRAIDNAFIKELPDAVDPCGENGEFHSFVYDGPIFKNKVDFKLGEKLLRTYDTNTADNKYWYVDLLP